MPGALCLIREAPHYRRDAFLRGLRSAGFELVARGHKPRLGDLLVIWNRYGDGEMQARRFEGCGAAVAIAENGYIGHHHDDYAKPYTADGEQLYSLSLSQHNGAGQWWCGVAGRWKQHGIAVKPWRENGDHVLVLGQRGFGPPEIAMPNEWPDRATQLLRGMTKRPIRARTHPGNVPAKVPLENDLANAWCAVTWGSGAAIKALCAGIPVFSDFDRWIGMSAARPLSGGFIETPLCDDRAREKMLDRLAWAQHTVSEISTGEPFWRLMEIYQARAKAA